MILCMAVTTYRNPALVLILWWSFYLYPLRISISDYTDNNDLLLFALITTKGTSRLCRLSKETPQMEDIFKFFSICHNNFHSSFQRVFLHRLWRWHLIDLTDINAIFLCWYLRPLLMTGSHQGSKQTQLIPRQTEVSDPPPYKNENISFVIFKQFSMLRVNGSFNFIVAKCRSICIVVVVLWVYNGSIYTYSLRLIQSHWEIVRLSMCLSHYISGY